MQFVNKVRIYPIARACLGLALETGEAFVVARLWLGLDLRSELGNTKQKMNINALAKNQANKIAVIMFLSKIEYG